MLQTLHIKNFALIEYLNIDFSNRLSIITGETGAGKSILLGALGLVLGNRADLSSLKDKSQKCVVEAHFNINGYNLKDFFITSDLDYEDVTIIRREILPSGKSRAFVNDSPVNLQQLQALSHYLIDIHSQQQTRELSDEVYQMHIVDVVAANADIIAGYKKQLSEYKSLQSELKKLNDQKSTMLKEHDYNSFLLEELLSANLKPGEQEELEAELEKLGNVEVIKESLAKAVSVSQDEQVGVLHSLNEIKASIHKISGFTKEYGDFYERVSSILIEFDDIVSGLSDTAEMLSDDPERLEAINQKLQLIYTLEKKHQAATVDELIAIREELDSKVLLADELDGTIEKLTNEIETAREKLEATALIIHNSREKILPKLTDDITAILSELGMPNARFNFAINYTDTFNSTGKDSLEVLFSANKGTDFGMLKKVASGGEMSRIMLAIKAILANHAKLPTIIFDEIDTGVSGEIANKMAEIMKQMSRGMQVFAITHLPQIAAKGDQHYKVFKRTQGNTTVSELKLLETEERIREIAEMLSGKDISESALTHARALLN